MKLPQCIQIIHLNIHNYHSCFSLVCFSLARLYGVYFFVFSEIISLHLLYLIFFKFQVPLKTNFTSFSASISPSPPKLMAFHKIAYSYIYIPLLNLPEPNFLINFTNSNLRQPLPKHLIQNHKNIGSTTIFKEIQPKFQSKSKLFLQTSSPFSNIVIKCNRNNP